MYCDGDPVNCTDPTGHIKNAPVPWSYITSWNAIHNLVQADIHMQYRYSINVYYKDTHRYADVVDFRTYSVWEIKPWTWSHSATLAYLRKKYIGMHKVNGGWHYMRYGGINLVGRTFDYGKYSIRYWNEGNGVIKYEFWLRMQPVFEYVPALASQPAYNRAYRLVHNHGYDAQAYIYTAGMLCLILMGGAVLCFG